LENVYGSRNMKYTAVKKVFEKGEIKNLKNKFYIYNFISPT